MVYTLRNGNSNLYSVEVKSCLSMTSILSYMFHNISFEQLYQLYKSLYIQMDNIDNMTDKVKVLLEKEVVNDLIKLKNVGDTYSDVIKGLMSK